MCTWLVFQSLRQIDCNSTRRLMSYKLIILCKLYCRSFVPTVSVAQWIALRICNPESRGIESQHKWRLFISMFWAVVRYHVLNRFIIAVLTRMIAVRKLFQNQFQILSFVLFLIIVNRMLFWSLIDFFFLSINTWGKI